MRLLLGIGAAALMLSIGSCSVEDNQKSTPTTPPTVKELNSPDIPNGQIWSHTFSTPGTYGYHCSRHTNMTGTVVVASGKPGSATVTIANSTNSGFQPHAVEVAPFGTVAWTNSSGATHTVTSN
jgi:plastocyanin